MPLCAHNALFGDEKMKYLLGIVSIIACLILSSFDTFRNEILLNAAIWGVAMSVIYMALVAMTPEPSD